MEQNNNELFDFQKQNPKQLADEGRAEKGFGLQNLNFLGIVKGIVKLPYALLSEIDSLIDIAHDYLSFRKENAKEAREVGKLQMQVEIERTKAQFQNAVMKRANTEGIYVTDKSLALLDGKTEKGQKYVVSKKYAYANSDVVASLAKIGIIREGTFANCAELKYVNLSETEVVEKGAFKNCKKLSVLDLGNVKFFDVHALDGCEQGVVLTNVNPNVVFTGEGQLPSYVKIRTGKQTEKTSNTYGHNALPDKEIDAINENLQLTVYKKYPERIYLTEKKTKTQQGTFNFDELRTEDRNMYITMTSDGREKRITPAEGIRNCLSSLYYRSEENSRGQRNVTPASFIVEGKSQLAHVPDLKSYDTELIKNIATSLIIGENYGTLKNLHLGLQDKNFEVITPKEFVKMGKFFRDTIKEKSMFYHDVLEQKAKIKRILIEEGYGTEEGTVDLAKLGNKVMKRNRDIPREGDFLRTITSAIHDEIRVVATGYEFPESNTVFEKAIMETKRKNPVIDLCKTVESLYRKSKYKGKEGYDCIPNKSKNPEFVKGKLQYVSVFNQALTSGNRKKMAEHLGTAIAIMDCMKESFSKGKITAVHTAFENLRISDYDQDFFNEVDNYYAYAREKLQGNAKGVERYAVEKGIKHEEIMDGESFAAFRSQIHTKIAEDVEADLKKGNFDEKESFDNYRYGKELPDKQAQTTPVAKDKRPDGAQSVPASEPEKVKESPISENRQEEGKAMERKDAEQSVSENKQEVQDVSEKKTTEQSVSEQKEHFVPDEQAKKSTGLKGDLSYNENTGRWTCSITEGKTDTKSASTLCYVDVTKTVEEQIKSTLNHVPENSDGKIYVSLEKPPLEDIQKTEFEVNRKTLYYKKGNRYGILKDENNNPIKLPEPNRTEFATKQNFREMGAQRAENRSF